ncbi:hypothetical protein G2W53_039651 [Senna tora]|uniref:Uncharacterized protein n=1 Tax=Senna tora TaxID=362788 RepID=A0A834SN02_9FABA|nr:hypothetical protein G2W53_039651 [Senna tora]
MDVLGVVSHQVYSVLGGYSVTWALQCGTDGTVATLRWYYDGTDGTVTGRVERESRQKSPSIHHNPSTLPFFLNPTPYPPFTNSPTSFPLSQVKTFNASGIRSYYNLPCVNECRYEELKDDDTNFPWNEIEEELGACWDPQEGSKRYILRSDMNATARIWLILIASNIKPSKYLTKISRKTTLLLYLLMTNQPVKLEAIIYKSLCKVSYNGRAGCALIFPHMISDFYFNAGVPKDDTDAKFKPKHQLD